MSPKSYNVILMRDDAHVRRFRLKPMWLKLGVYLAGCVVLSTLISIWISLSLWYDNDTLQQEVIDLKQAAHESAVELQRLQNMERMLKKVADPSLGQQTVLETLTLGGDTSQPVSESDLDLNTLLAEKNTGRAEVRRVSLAPGDGVWKLSFELSNPDKTETLEGLYLINIVAANGTHHNVSLDREQVHFRIQRFKKIEIEFTPPAELPKEEIFGLRLTIDRLGGATIYTRAWQLSSLVKAS